LQGAIPSVDAGNSTIVKRHSSGYIFANFFNTAPNDVSSGVTKVCVEIDNDGYIRHGSPAAIATFVQSSIKLDDLGAPDNTTDLDATTSKHGLLKKLGGGTDNFLRADGAWADPSDVGDRCVCIPVSASDEGVTTGDGTIAFAAPLSLDGYDLVDALANVYTQSASGTTDIQVRRRRGANSADMLSTKITIATDEYYARDGVVNTSNDDVATGDKIYIDVDAAGSGAQGLSVTLTFRKP